MLLRILILSLLLSASAQADAAEEEPDCRQEAELSRAAAELLLRARPPDAAALSDALREAGSDMLAVRALLVPDREHARMRQWLSEFKEAADAEPVCGYARDEGAHLLLIAARAGSLAPLHAESTHVRGALAAHWSKPELVVADGYGELSRLAVDARALERGIPIAEELARPARIQLLARGPQGPRPIAERVLPSSDAEALSPPGIATSDASPLALLEALRSERGLPALRDNRVLGAVAAEHARHVCSTGRIAHELERGEDPETRLRHAGIHARRVGEAIARASAPARAFAALARSPSHLLTLLQRGFTDVGVGEAQDATERTCLVVLLAEWPRFVGRVLNPARTNSPPPEAAPDRSRAARRTAAQ